MELRRLAPVVVVGAGEPSENPATVAMEPVATSILRTTGADMEASAKTTAERDGQNAGA